MSGQDNAALLRIEVEALVTDLDRGARKFIANADVDGEIGRKTPVVLEVAGIECRAHVLAAVADGALSASWNAEQIIGDSVAIDLSAGIAAVEGEGGVAGEVGDLKIGLAADLEAGAHVVLAPDIAEVIGELQVLVGRADGLRERSNRAKTLDAENRNAVHDRLIGGVLEAKDFASVILAERSLGETESPAAVEAETELIEDPRSERVYPGGCDESIGQREAFAAERPQILAVAGLLRPGKCPEDLIA